MDAKQGLGEPRALVSRSALLHNARLLRQTVGHATRICAIVKADAYGHDARIVVDTLTNFEYDGVEPPLVDAFAVANIDEAAAFPVTNLPVYVFRPVENAYIGQQREKLEAAIRNGWILTVCTPAAAEDVARLALACGKRANVQIMIDTGMNRSGVQLDRFRDLFARISTLPSLRLDALCTHFACSEEVENPATAEQFAAFRSVTDHLRKGDRPLFTRHVANSGAIFFHPQTHLEMVRPGIALYGIDPTCEPSIDRNLRPALKWTAPLLMIRPIRAGDAVGYGQTWRAPRDTHVGLVPVGYADGYMRAFSSQANVMLNGRPCPVVGRVSMDLITIDLGTQPRATVGDEVTILDNDPLSPASAYALAKAADTIPYEIFCRIGSRIPRIAVEPEEIPVTTRYAHRATDAA